MAILNREAILKAEDRKTREVEVPEWGGSVVVKGLSSRQRDAYESSLLVVDKRGNFTMSYDNAKAKLVALAVFDEDNQPIFTQADVEALGEKSANAVNRVFEVAQELSGLKAEDIENTKKN